MTNGKRALGPYGLWLNLVLISGTWGSSFILVKLISPSVPPFAFAAERGGIAMTALLLWLAVRSPLGGGTGPRTRVWTWRNLRHMVVLGTTNGWLANVLTAVAVVYADSAVVAMIQATVPLMVAVLAHFLFEDERFRTRQLIGVLMGLFGIALIIGPLAVFGGRGSLIGIGAMLFTAFSYASGTIYGRHIAATDSAVLACGQQACGALIAAAISLLTESFTIWNQPARIWLLLTIVGVLCSAVPTVLYLRLLSRTTAVPAALVAYLQPVWAMLLGWLVIGEQISSLALIGTALVFVAVTVSTRRQAR